MSQGGGALQRPSGHPLRGIEKRIITTPLRALRARWRIISHRVWIGGLGLQKINKKSIEHMTKVFPQGPKIRKKSWSGGYPRLSGEALGPSWPPGAPRATQMRQTLLRWTPPDPPRGTVFYICFYNSVMFVAFVFACIFRRPRDTILEQFWKDCWYDFGQFLFRFIICYISSTSTFEHKNAKIKTCKSYFKHFWEGWRRRFFINLRLIWGFIFL